MSCLIFAPHWNSFSEVERLERGEVSLSYSLVFAEVRKSIIPILICETRARETLIMTIETDRLLIYSIPVFSRNSRISVSVSPSRQGQPSV